MNFDVLFVERSIVVSFSAGRIVAEETVDAAVLAEREAEELALTGLVIDEEKKVDSDFDQKSLNWVVFADREPEFGPELNGQRFLARTAVVA